MNDILDGTYPESGSITIEQMRSLKSAKCWIYEQGSEIPDDPFSFCGVCNALGLDSKEVIERLEKKLYELNATRRLAKKLNLNGSHTADDVRRKAGEYIEAEMRGFGHEVEITVNRDLSIECSKPYLEQLCKNILGV